VRFKGNKFLVGLLLLITIVLLLGVVSSCTGGTFAAGWSGGVVYENKLFVGTNDGKQGLVVAWDLADNSISQGKPIVFQSTGSLLSCACGTSSSGVPIYGTPVIVGNRVYVAAYDGKVYAYKTDNLASLWDYPDNGSLGALVGGLAYHNGVLYIGSSDFCVYAINAETGSEIAKFKTGDKVWGTPAVDPVTNTLFIGSYDKKLYALDLTNLNEKWSVTTEGSIVCTPLVDNGTLYFGSFDRNIYALDAATGTQKWTFRGGNWFWAQTVLFNGKLYAGCLDHFVYVLDPSNGQQTASFDLKGAVASPPVNVDNLLVFATRTGVVYKLDTDTMQMKDLHNYDLAIDGPIMAYDGIVYLHPQSNYMLRIDPVAEKTLDAKELN
jgi:eukaryotic-like serine/threonine-protein kinase